MDLEGGMSDEDMGMQKNQLLKTIMKHHGKSKNQKE